MKKEQIIINTETICLEKNTGNIKKITDINKLIADTGKSFIEKYFDYN